MKQWYFTIDSKVFGKIWYGSDWWCYTQRQVHINTWVITFEHLHVNDMGIEKTHLPTWKSIYWMTMNIDIEKHIKLLYLSWFSTWEYGETDNDIIAHKCRSSFPIPPMSKTVILEPIDFESEAEENKFKMLGKESGWQPRQRQLGD